jgi:hypothetical protein
MSYGGTITVATATLREAAGGPPRLLSTTLGKARRAWGEMTTAIPRKLGGIALGGRIGPAGPREVLLGRRPVHP